MDEKSGSSSRPRKRSPKPQRLDETPELTPREEAPRPKPRRSPGYLPSGPYFIEWDGLVDKPDRD